MSKKARRSTGYLTHQVLSQEVKIFVYVPQSSEVEEITSLTVVLLKHKRRSSFLIIYYRILKVS